MGGKKLKEQKQNKAKKKKTCRKKEKNIIPFWQERSAALDSAE